MGAKNPVEKQGAIIHHLKMVIAFCRKPLAGSLMISAKVLCSNHPEEATLPLRCLATATPLWTCRPETPCATSCSRPASFISRAILIYGNLV